MYVLVVIVINFQKRHTQKKVLQQPIMESVYHIFILVLSVEANLKKANVIMQMEQS